MKNLRTFGGDRGLGGSVPTCPATFRVIGDCKRFTRLMRDRRLEGLQAR